MIHTPLQWAVRKELLTFHTVSLEPHRGAVAVHGHRNLKQVANPYYYGDYVDECFAGLDVIAALNQTDNLTTLIDAFTAAGLDCMSRFTSECPQIWMANVHCTTLY